MFDKQIGIDKIGVYVPSYYIDMVELAEARGIEPDKLTIGIGQEQMAVAPISQDIVTMGANAAAMFLTDEDRKAIDCVILGTESGIDQSKAGSVYIHDLLGLQPFARAIEIKEACYGATAGMQLAVSHIATHPGSKVLVIGSDIARYGLNTGGETTQGAGAVAMLVAENPSIAVINNQSTVYTSSIMDFWRPNYTPYAQVDGKFSNEQYLHFLTEVWTEHKRRYNVTIDDFKAFVYHLPYTKMGLKGLRTMLPEASEAKQADLLAHFESSKALNKKVGNIYTGSVFLSFLSLLVDDASLEAGDTIGMFSYGSGAVGEFLTLDLVEGFKRALPIEAIQTLFDAREKISVAEYEALFVQVLPEDGSTMTVDIENDKGPFILTGITEHMRQYAVK